MCNILFTGVYQVFDNYIFSKFSEAFNANNIICTGSNVEDFQKENLIRVISNSPLNKNESEYTLFLKKIIHKYDINLIVPMVDSEVSFLSKNKNSFNCKIFSADSKTVDLCHDKVKCHEILGDFSPQYYKITDPDTLKNILDLNPNKTYVIRPYGSITGSGKGMRILSKKGASNSSRILSSSGTRELSFEEYYNSYKSIFKNIQYTNLEFILTDYLPGQEYSCYLTSSNGKLIDLCINKKMELESGTTNTARAVIINNTKIKDIVREISKKLNLHLISNIQLKEDVTGEFKLVEVNPRIAGSIMLPIMAGYDFFKQSESILKNQNIVLNADQNKTLKMIRIYNEVFK